MLANASLSRETLARAFEQSADCVKLISLDGCILWMNPNGQCAMEIDDISTLRGVEWASLWPEESRETIKLSLTGAATGDVTRFTAFCPTAKGSPRWWNVSVSSVEDEDGNPSGFLSISRDITAEERSKQAALLANKEIQHRLGNTIAVVNSLMMGFARGTTEHEAFAKEMQKRLIALNAVQRLFAGDQASCRVDSLMAKLVAPLDGSHASLTMGKVPSITIDRGQADAIALVVGELMVNSIKHGAIANAGTVHIDVVVESGQLKVRWTESLREHVRARSREGGQGLSLIKDIVASRDGELDTVWQDAGLIVTVTFKIGQDV